MKFEESFGIIPLRKEDGEWQVFLVEHAQGHFWGFPKGHAEEGESPFASAKRELKEETNLDIQSLVTPDPLVEQYQYMRNSMSMQKLVTYFIAEVTGDVVLQTAEIQNGLWFSFPQAMSKLTYKEGKRVLSQVIQIVM